MIALHVCIQARYLVDFNGAYIAIVDGVLFKEGCCNVGRSMYLFLTVIDDRILSDFLSMQYLELIQHVESD